MGLPRRGFTLVELLVVIANIDRPSLVGRIDYAGNAGDMDVGVGFGPGSYQDADNWGADTWANYPGGFLADMVIRSLIIPNACEGIPTCSAAAFPKGLLSRNAEKRGTWKENSINRRGWNRIAVIMSYRGKFF